MNSKHVFWEALLIAIFIFAAGILLGYLLEANRTSGIISTYQQSELSLLDIRIQESIFSGEDFDCARAQEEIVDFADRVYIEAKILDRYEGASRLSEGIVLQHKKYDLLRTILWLNSIEIKEKCNTSFHTIVYFYEYQTEDLDLKAEQNVFSKYLFELKQEYGNQIILIPIAGNLELNSISFLLYSYNITSLPTVLVDEEFKVEEMDSLDEIKSYLE